MILASGLSDVGCRRSNNEDRIWMDLESSAFALADGMGGENCGEVAAELAVNTVAAYLRGALRPDLAADQIMTAIQAANRRVFETSRNGSGCMEMGCTLLVVNVTGKIATIGAVGDSRVYFYRSGTLSRVTRDDSIVAKLLDAGEISPEEADKHPLRNMLTQAVGKTERVVPQIHQVQLIDGDRLMLSSDGLHGVISHDSMCDILRSSDDVDDAVRRLIAEGRKRGAPDNLSCVLIEYLNDA
jgi:PPM family protein phosphatase